MLFEMFAGILQIFTHQSEDSIIKSKLGFRTTKHKKFLQASVLCTSHVYGFFGEKNPQIYLLQGFMYPKDILAMHKNGTTTKLKRDFSEIQIFLKYDDHTYIDDDVSPPLLK